MAPVYHVAQTENKRHKARPIKYCKGCGKELAPSSKHTARYDYMAKRQYCSNSCRTGILHSNWRGGRYLVGKGYIKRNFGRGKSQYEHILVAEKALGRRLKDDECVHHINLDKTDNRNENLLVCSNAYHRWLHEEMGRLYAEEHFSPKPSDPYIPDIGQPIGYGPVSTEDPRLL